jgi:hypothetical protein
MKKLIMVFGLLFIGFIGCVEDDESDDIIERCNGSVIEAWDWETGGWQPDSDCSQYQCQGADHP